MGTVLLTIVHVSAGIPLFLLILFIVLLGFANALFLLVRLDGHTSGAALEGYGTVGDSLLTMFTAVASSQDLDNLYATAVPGLSIAIFVAYLVIQVGARAMTGT